MVLGDSGEEIANLFKNNDIENAKVLLYKVYRFVWLLSFPICFGLLAIAPTLIPVFLGDGYEDSVLLLRIFSVLTIFISLSYVTGLSYLVATKQQNIYTIAVTVAALLNLALNILLIPQLKSTGAAIASISAEIVGFIIQIVYCIIKKQLEWKKIFIPSIRYLVCGFLMFVAVYLIGLLIPNPTLRLFIMVASGGIFYFLLLLLTKDLFVGGEIKSFISKLKNKQKQKDKGQTDIQ